MSRFNYIYEDPSYDREDNEESNWEDAVTDFRDWNKEAQDRLLKDIFSPFETINS